jgi:hypothetical protein
VFSVTRGPCRVCTRISEPNFRARSCESQVNGNITAYSGVQQGVRELEFGASRRRSEFRESADEGVRLWLTV